MELEGNIPNTVDLSDSTSTSIPPITSALRPVAANGLGLMSSASHTEKGVFSPVNCIYIPYEGVV